MICFMVDVTVGVKVLICPSEEQKDLFHKNFGGSRKAYNELLGKYNELYKKDNTINPKYSFLSKLLNEIKMNCLIWKMLNPQVYSSLPGI